LRLAEGAPDTKAVGAQLRRLPVAGGRVSEIDGNCFLHSLHPVLMFASLVLKSARPSFKRPRVREMSSSQHSAT
jgi:hypothetical protein